VLTDNRRRAHDTAPAQAWCGALERLALDADAALPKVERGR